MANYLLAWGNRADAATLSGGSWSVTLPLNNLKNRQVQRVARSTNDDLTSTQFVVDNGSIKAVQALALVVHNLSAPAKYRITGNDSAVFTTPLYDSGWLDVWPAGIIPVEQLEWEDDNFWLGTMTAEQRAGYNVPLVHMLTTAQSLRYWQFEFDDTTNPAGYVQFGRLFMAPAFQPVYNASYGASMGYEDPTEVATALSGAEYFDIRGRYRVHSFSLEFLNSNEAHNQVLELQRLQGTSGEVLIVPNVTDSTTFVQRSFVGRMQKLSPVSQPYFSAWSTSFEIKELI